MSSFAIKVPCSSANIGPGYDVVGLALSLWLELQVTIDQSSTDNVAASGCTITCEGLGKESIDLAPDRNLITQTALYVLRCHDQPSFPQGTHVHIVSGIPFGRGLGSSGAAVVAGVMLASEAGGLSLTKDRMLDFCLMIERHPDNVAAALFGGFVGSYLKDLNPQDMERKEIPLSEVLPAPAGGVDTGLKPPVPPVNIGKHIKFNWAPEIKCIAIVPDFEVSTAKARSVLPASYPKADIVANLQRIALLTTALGQSPPNAELIYDGMQDRIHQPYRQGLIPGLTEILKSVTPESHPGLMGICLSGAGPTILALATHNFDAIADHLIKQFKKENICCDYKLLEPAFEGATVERGTNHEKGAEMTYASAGVSIDAGNDLVKRIKSCMATTKRPGADAVIGGFGGVVDLAAAGYPDAPLIVQAIDGIGTKLMIACSMKKYDTVGIDLVAMNVNDLIVQGAEPLTFLDYYACGKLDVDAAAAFVSGVAKGCQESGCALVGGETAEMPGIYSGGDFDAAGCATGALRRDQKMLPDLDAMQEGDILIGLASNGVHSNGFSLVRKIVKAKGLNFTDNAPWNESMSVGESLLTPTRIYVKSLLKAIGKSLVKGMAHITGGGLYDNVPRMLPKTLAAEIDVSTWQAPPVMNWLRRAGNMSSIEYARTFNTGLGMVLVVDKSVAEEVASLLTSAGEQVFAIGRLVRREQEDCILRNVDSWN